MIRAGAFLLIVAVASPAWAVGLDGSGEAEHRATMAVGAGLDRVGGYANDTYPFVEVGGSYEAVVWKRLTLGAAASFRQDLDDHNDALERWRHERSPAIAVQTWIGYDGPGFHISAGPWLYGAERERQRKEQTRQRKAPDQPLFTAHSTLTRLAPLRPKVSGVYISSTRVEGSTNLPSEVARARYR